VISQLSLVGAQVVEWKSNPWLFVSQVLRRPTALKELGSRRHSLIQATPSAISLTQLSDEQVSDVIERLGMLPALEWVSIPEGGFSPRSVEAFRRSLPQIEIVVTPR
jgi:hypothetical protein